MGGDNLLGLGQQGGSVAVGPDAKIVARFIRPDSNRTLVRVGGQTSRGAKRLVTVEISC